MGKKSRSISTATGSVASNNAVGSTTTRTATAAGERSSAHAEADSQHETRYRRLKVRAEPTHTLWLHSLMYLLYA